MADFVPGKDADFDAWFTNFHTYLMAHLDHWGFTPVDTDPLDTAFAAWQVGFNAHEAAKVAEKTTRETKVADRAAAELIVRSLVKRIQGNLVTTNADREALKITVPALAMAAVDLGVSEDRPLAIIDVNARQRHVIRIQNQTATGTKRGKPAGAKSCEIWMKIGAEPTGPEDMQLLDKVTRSPFQIDFADEHAGKQVYYAMRWVGTNGSRGPWSETESATIAA